MSTLAWFGVGLWLALLFSAGWYSRLRWERRTRARRRGGYVKPPASPEQSRTATSTSAATHTAVASTSFCPPPGGVSEAWEIPRLLRDPSRITERGWSTGAPAARGGSGLRRGSAA